MTWRTLGPLAAALVIVGVIVAILAPSNGRVIDPVAQAADTTAAAGTAEFSITGSVTAAGQKIPLNGSGALDMANQRMRMSMSFPVPELGSMQIDELFDGDAFYMHLPESLASRLPGGKTWMKLDLDTLGKASGVDLKQMLQANQGNPADMLKALEGVGDSRLVGAESIGGTETKHYRADLDLNKAADRMPDKKSAEAVRQLFQSSGVTTMPVDVWVDGAGRVRREHVGFSSTAMAMDFTIEFTRFGVPVDVNPPPAGQVLDAGALLGAAG
jgi:hypothetical protein